jgi:YVTN family beta-propeller protein
MRTFFRKHAGMVMFSLVMSGMLLTAFQQYELPNAGSAVPTSTFANFESAHVHPLDMTPDGTKLLAVNTANNSLEVFQLGGPMMLNVASIPVGLDPVTVRVRSNTEAWVVDQVSDEISIVDLTTNRVVRSLTTQDEPADVVFAGTPQKAFVSCAGRESVQVFDPANLGTAPAEVLLKGEQPRALAVSPDGSTVYCAFFESGNATTVLNGNNFFNFQHGTFGNGTPRKGICSPQGGCTVIPNDVTNPAGPFGGAVNAAAGIVPNAGTGFNPPLNPGNPPTPETKSLIVRKNASGQWMDDNGGNWTSMVSGSAAGKARMVGWDMPDRDVAVINANSPSTASVTYQARLGNILMAMAVRPGGEVTIVGTEATNEIRFEPVLNGKFLRVNLSRFSSVGGANTITDLNPHINYANISLPQPQRVASIGDPRAIVWKADGSKAYISGMGSNNVVMISPSGARVGNPIVVGEGPTGLVLDETRSRGYVLNKFEGTVSTVDLATDKETARANFFDPTPQVIKAGRKHLYNTHLGSGNGHISCGSCHVDGRWDRLAWDLGNPAGAMEVVDGKTFHPLKGVKTTQFLIDIIDRGRGNLHWRGDKGGFADFAGAFEHLQGLAAPKPLTEMQEFEDFLAATWYVPNPYRAFKPSSQSSTERMNAIGVRGTGTTFQTVPPAVPLFVSMNVNCAHCHNAQTGRGELMGNGSVAGTGAGTLVDFGPNRNMSADLRSTYRKNGFFYNSNESTSGFGMMSEGVMETWFNGGGVANYLGDYEPELLSWSGGIDPANCSACLSFPLSNAVVNDALPGVGMRETFNGATIGNTTNLATMLDLAKTRAGEYGMIVKGVYGGAMRGFYYTGGASDTYQSDIAGQTVTHTQLLISAQGSGGPLSWTLVVPQTRIRMGVDADADGILDHDDLNARVNVRAILEGPFDGTTMKSDLNTNNLLPSTDPFGFGETMNPAVKSFVGLSAPVDWAKVELRSNVNPATVVASRAVLIQRSGNLMQPTGEQTIIFPGVPAGNYHVVVKHRNHFGMMTFSPYLLRDPGTLVDFSTAATSTYGTGARKTVGSSEVMWMGNVTGDGLIQYTGSGNDRDPVLVRVGSTTPNNTIIGYYLEDANLDGTVKYTGGANDRDPILVNVGSTVPTNTKVEQLP